MEIFGLEQRQWVKQKLLCLKTETHLGGTFADCL